MNNPTSNLVTRLKAFPGGVGAEALCREAADELERLRDIVASFHELLALDPENRPGTDLYDVMLRASGDSSSPETSALPQLRRIDKAARDFVDVFDCSAVEDYLKQECAPEWEELNNALFDGRSSAQETSRDSLGDGVPTDKREHQPPPFGGGCPNCDCDHCLSRQSPGKASVPVCGLCGKPGVTELARTCCGEGRARDLAAGRQPENGKGDGG